MPLEKPLEIEREEASAFEVEEGDEEEQ